MTAGKAWVLMTDDQDWSEVHSVLASPDEFTIRAGMLAYMKKLRAGAEPVLDRIATIGVRGFMEPDSQYRDAFEANMAAMPGSWPRRAAEHFAQPGHEAEFLFDDLPAGSLTMIEVDVVGARPLLAETGSPESGAAPAFRA